MNQKEISELPMILEEDYPFAKRSQFVHTSLYHLSSTQPDRLHYHTALELGLCLSGEGTCYINSEMQSFHKGDVEVILPFQPHFSVRAEDCADSCWNFVSIDPMRIGSANLKPVPSFIAELIKKRISVCGIFAPDRYPALTALISDLIALSRDNSEPQEFAKELLSAKSIELLIELARISSEDTFCANKVLDHQYEMIAPAIKFVSKNTGNGSVVTVTQMAKACAMSESYFRKIFTSTVGLAPKSYIDRSILAYAANELSYTNEPISAIVAALGFEEASTFYRKFMKYYGVSPSEYRKSARYKTAE